MSSTDPDDISNCDTTTLSRANLQVSASTDDGVSWSVLNASLRDILFTSNIELSTDGASFLVSFFIRNFLDNLDTFSTEPTTEFVILKTDLTFRINDDASTDKVLLDEEDLMPRISLLNPCWRLLYEDSELQNTDVLTVKIEGFIDINDNCQLC